HRARHRNRGADTVLACLVAGGGDDSAFIRVASHDNRLAPQCGFVPLFDGRIERVHVDVEDASHESVDPNPPRVGLLAAVTSVHVTRGAGRTMPWARRSPRRMRILLSVMFSTCIITSSSAPQ